MSGYELPKKFSRLSVRDTDKTLVKDRDAQKRQMRHLLWFHGQTNRALSETKLKKVGDIGTFLIRDNVLTPGDYVLSCVVVAGKGNKACEHFVINQCKEGHYSFSTSASVFQGLDELVQHYSTEADGLPTKLTKPCPRGELPPPLSIKQGYTNLLHIALLSEKGTESDAKKILDSKECPNVNAKSLEGSTALHLSCKRGYKAVTSQLISKGAEVDRADADGFSPLHIACLHDHSELVKLLLEGGANPQYRHHKTGNVALHEAAQKGHIQCVKEMLKFHVPAWPRNYNKMTPHPLAIKFGNILCAKLFDDYVPPEPLTSPADWLHENMDRNGAVALLEKYQLADGYFLVRKHSRDADKYVLSLSANNQVFHLVVNTKPLFQIEAGPLHSSLPHLIQHYCNYPDGLEGILTYAIRPEHSGNHDADGSTKKMTTNIYGVEGGSAGSRAAALAKPSVPAPAPLPRQKPPLSKNPTELDPRSIKLEFEIGQGEYGSVMKGTWTSPDGQLVPVAVKTLNPQYLESDRDNFLREAQVMVRFDHPCIVKLIGMCEAESLLLVQELVSLGALLDFLLDYPEKIRVRHDLYLWAAQIACGMMYLEKGGFVHRDLATRNILLSSKVQAKVGDFGLSRAVGSSDYYRASKGGRWPVKWYAPESVNYGTFSSASDVWSYGITLWEMFSFGDQPYGLKTGAEVIQFLENNGRLARPEKCPDNVYAIMLACWAYNPPDRPTFKKLNETFRGDQEYVNTKEFLPQLDHTQC